MNNRALDYQAIAALHDKGLGVNAIARQIGATSGAVSKALKKLGRDSTRCAMPAAVKQHEKRVQVQEHLLFFLNDYMAEFQRLNEVNPEERIFGDLLDRKIALGAESRKIVSALADIAYKMFQAEEVAEILKIIDEEIGNESLECQARIRERIERRRAIRFPAIAN